MKTFVSILCVIGMLLGTITMMVYGLNWLCVILVLVSALCSTAIYHQYVYNVLTYGIEEE